MRPTNKQWSTLYWGKDLPLYWRSIYTPSYSNCWYGEYKQAWNNSDSTSTTNVNAFNVSSTICKDLSHITCFNYDKKGHYTIKCFEQEKRLVTVLTTSTLMTGALCYPGMRFLYLIPSSSPKISRRSYDSFDIHDGYDVHDNYSSAKGHGKFYCSRTSWKRFDFSRRLLVGWR